MKDNFTTPPQALAPLFKGIPNDWVIWEPFQGEHKSLVRKMESDGFRVIASGLPEHDFFEYEPAEHYDIIISNPPYSCSDKVIERLYALGKNWAMLLPITHLGGKKRQEMYRKHGGVSVIMLGGRLNFLTPTGKSGKQSNAQFESCWIIGGNWSGVTFPLEKITFETLLNYHWEAPDK